MPETRNYKLCLCLSCIPNQDIDPETGEIVEGLFIPPSTWSRHRSEEEVRNAQAQRKISQYRENLTSDNSILPNAHPTHLTTICVSEPPLLTGNDKGVKRSKSTKIPSPNVNPAPSHQDDDSILTTLMHYEKRLQNALSSFKPPRTLEFCTPPLHDDPFVTSFTITFPINSGPCALKRGQLDNEALLQFEDWLCQMHQSVSELGEGPPSYLALLSRIADGLKTIDRAKELIWNRQKRNPIADRPLFDNDSRAVTISTARFLDVQYPSSPSQIIAFKYLIHAAVLHTTCHISRERSNFSLTLQRDILQNTLSLTGYAALPSNKLLASIPSDIRKVHSILRLEPILLKYVCCPTCRSLYPYDEEVPRASNPTHCSFKSVSEGQECGTPLYNDIAPGSSATHAKPHLIYLFQDLSQWLGRLLCRPGIEQNLRSPLRDLDKPTPSIIRSIWHGTIVRNMKDTDGRPFFRDLQGKLRLLFGIGYDNFNPFHNKQAGKKVSIGAIFLFLYNLPESIRLKPENIYIVGIVHGPTQPHLTELNHYMDPLITQFETFYNRGFFYPETPDSPDGILVQGGICPLIMDLHALRQVTGTGSYHSKHFCIYCLLPLEHIYIVDPTKWPKWHTAAEHRYLAQMWHDAPTEDIRKQRFQENYIRWSPFLRLPYFEADLMSSIEPMHAFQNICRNLVRNTWGIDHKNQSGDGLFVGKRPKGSDHVMPNDLVAAYKALASEDVKKLKNTRLPVLFHLCEVHNLRRVGKADLLRKSLIDFYSTAPDQLKADLQSAEAAANSQTEYHSPEMFKLRQRLQTVTLESRENVITWLSRKPLPDLQALCLEREIETKSYKRGQLAEFLVEHQLQNPIPLPSVHLTQGKAVLGADIISEIDKDINRTILPSWTATGPKEFDMSQHGKQSAAEWRTTVLIRLVVTLPRIWGPIGGRMHDMLDNFMHLTNALVVISTRAVVRSQPDRVGTADLYRREYLAYLQGRVKLYPTGIITPTEHLAYHMSDKLESIGPVHIQSANVFERFNGMLQDIPSNMRMGELETTLMTKFCTAANLKALLNHPDVPIPLHAARDSFNKVFGIEGGAMIQDVLSYEEDRFFYPHKKDLDPSQIGTPDPIIEKLVITCLNSRYETDMYSTLEDFRMWSINRAQYRGVWYHKSKVGTSKAIKTPSHRDSHILVKSRNAGKSRPEPYVIKQIIAMEYGPPNSSDTTLGIFLIVRPQVPLTSEDAANDKWRRYPISGGRLYYDKLAKQLQVCMIEDVVGHFAKTPFKSGELPGIKESCVHVLPLFWHGMFDWLEYLSDAVEVAD